MELPVTNASKGSNLQPVLFLICTTASGTSLQI